MEESSSRSSEPVLGNQHFRLFNQPLVGWRLFAFVQEIKGDVAVCRIDIDNSVVEINLAGVAGRERLKVEDMFSLERDGTVTMGYKHGMYICSDEVLSQPRPQPKRKPR